MTRINLDCPRECLPLQDWSASLVTHSGQTLRARPVREGDEDELADFLRRLSRSDRQFRFPGVGRAVQPDRIAKLLDVDHGLSEHFIGTLPHEGRIIASALFTGDAQHETGAVAIAIDRAQKHQGFGWALLAHVARYARAHGFKRLVSIESRQNQAALAVEGDMGFTVTPLPGDKDLVMVEAEL